MAQQMVIKFKGIAFFYESGSRNSWNRNLTETSKDIHFLLEQISSYFLEFQLIFTPRRRVDFHKKMETICSSFFCFSFSWRNWKANFIKKIKLTFCYFAQVYAIQNQAHINSPEIFRCTLVTRTPRIYCLETADVFEHSVYSKPYRLFYF